MAVRASKRAVTVVVPVYGDWPSLAQCIEALKEHVGPRHSVMFVNDCGPEVDLMEKNIKQLIAGTGFRYFRNPKNLGFVGTCNRAVLELDQTKNDILLLNSDAKPTGGFLEEMLAVLYASDKHGAVSPRSNNATINTVPLWAAHQKGIEPKESFRQFRLLRAKLPRYNEVPVAHGFCMLIRRSLIQKYGLFDTAFGRGYGEEVDFCLRIAAHGYKCALSNRAYVFHLEARSFTPAAKAKLLEENNKIIWQRYPDYRQSVRDYMEQALVRETAAAEKAGIKPPKKNPRARLKDLIKRSPRLYKLAKALRNRAN